MALIKYNKQVLSLALRVEVERKGIEAVRGTRV